MKSNKTRTLFNVLLLGILVFGLVLMFYTVYDILGMFGIGADGS